jgi:ABC-type lipoprotein export system ATPase subunit
MIEAEGLVKIYKTKEIEVLALQGLDLVVEEGEFTALIGNSGSGKSTFLNMIGGLDRPSAGRLTVGGKNLFRLTEKELVAYKRDTVGFVWQNNARNLFPYLTAVENVCLPMNFAGSHKKRARALELLELVGMEKHKNDRLGTLSGGEQQRIAIAIALANSPKLLLADEPTGSVDAGTADRIFQIFTELNKNGQTILVVTHDLTLSKKVRRVVAIRDGKISSERILRESYSDRLKESQIDWRSEDTQEEYAVMDRAGRVQIPKDIMERAQLSGNRLLVEYEDGRIIMRKHEETKPAEPKPDTGSDPGEPEQEGSRQEGSKEEGPRWERPEE